jgi:predicted DNA-binding ribbon-helix-helix protein
MATALRLECALWDTTLAEISRRVGISTAMLSLMMDGKRRCSPQMAARLFQAVHAPIYERGGLVLRDEPRELAYAGD